MASSRGQARTRAAGSARRTYAAGTRSAAARRGNGGNRGRFSAVRLILVAVLLVAGGKLVQVQWFEAGALSAAAERQRAQTIDIPAQRGSIVDRNGAKLAFSVEVRTLSVNLKALHKSMDDFAAKNPGTQKTFDSETAAAAKYISGKVPNLVSEQQLLDLFRKQASFTYLVNNVEPSVAADIVKHFAWIGVEKRALREYPGGS